MTDVATDEARTYRFAPVDRTGLLLGLSGVQCALLAAGIFLAGAALQAGVHLVAVLAPLVVGSTLAFGSWNGYPFHDVLPIAGRRVVERVTGRASWRAPLPGFTGTDDDEDRQPALPPWLAGIELVDGGPVGWTAGPSRIGIVRDRTMRTLSASMPVRGREFLLVERDDQERILAAWGDVLGAFCAERGQVSGVRVGEWAAPAGPGARNVFATGSMPISAEARDAYAALLADAGPASVRHEVLVTVTVDIRRARRARAGGSQESAATAALLDELRLLATRLEVVGLGAGPPLSIEQVAGTFRERLDPTTSSRLSAHPRTLGQAVGLVRRWNASPLAVETTWSHAAVDSTVHRSYWIAEWPRLDVPPNWMEPMLLHAGGVRTFALDFHPIAPSRSRRRIDRDSTRLAADEEQRSRSGFRISAHHRRASSAVLERESELVAGYSELEYSGFVVVSAPNLDELDRSCAEYEQVAAQSGLQLRALDGRHDLGLVCTLPLGRGVAKRRTER